MIGWWNFSSTSHLGRWAKQLHYSYRPCPWVCLEQTEQGKAVFWNSHWWCDNLFHEVHQEICVQHMLKRFAPTRVPKSQNNWYFCKGPLKYLYVLSHSCLESPFPESASWHNVRSQVQVPVLGSKPLTPTKPFVKSLIGAERCCSVTLLSEVYLGAVNFWLHEIGQNPQLLRSNEGLIR